MNDYLDHVLSSIDHDHYLGKRLRDLSVAQVALLFRQWVPVIKARWSEASSAQQRDCLAIQNAFGNNEKEPPRQMTRIDKIIRIASALAPGLISERVKGLLAKAEYILEVAYSSDDDPTALAAYHAQSNSEEEPKEVVLSARAITIKAKKDWGTRRAASKPRQDRIDLVSLLKSYSMRAGLGAVEIAAQAKRGGFDISNDDVNHWFRGDHLPGDFKFDQIMKFLELNDKGTPPLRTTRGGADFS